jgi:hypothetical protein
MKKFASFYRAGWFFLRQIKQPPEWDQFEKPMKKSCLFNKILYLKY